MDSGRFKIENKINEIRAKLCLTNIELEMSSLVHVGSILMEAVVRLTGYEGRFSITYNCLILMLPLGADQATMPYIKAMKVLFHLLYGSLFCSKGLQSDRPKC